MAAALEDVITAINLTAMVVPHLEKLSDLETTPAAILVRITFEGSGDPAHAVIDLAFGRDAAEAGGGAGLAPVPSPVRP